MKKLVVLGAGISGVGAAILGKKKGYAVFVSDSNRIKPKFKIELESYSIPFEEEGHIFSNIIDADLVVISPGIPKDSEVIKLLRNKKIEIISELEFGSRYTSSKLIAITGTNGKTTTTSLVYHILLRAGLNVGLAGNIGESFARKVATENHDYYVLEVSSFQLDDIKNFKPYIAILLNITADHLDQYNGKLELYAKSKFRITSNQDQEDFFVYNFDDEYVVELLKDIKTEANMIPFSTIGKNESYIYASENEIISGGKPLMNLFTNPLPIQGKHNLSNALAAAAAANLLRIENQTIKEALLSFVAVEHRMEKVNSFNVIDFINDSKATNINATYYALGSMKKSNTIWIVGGVDKGNNYDEIYSLVKEKVKAIVCLGKDNEKIIKYFSSLSIPIADTKNMDDAISKAMDYATDGNTVLLSPACASFDLFENYQDRGKKFKESLISMNVK